MHYDTVIIGAGMSGLSAGVRLAYFEKNVCILERHTTVGGLNSFYRLRKRNYDVGLHAVTNYAEPGSKGGPLSKLLRQLRMKWEDFDLRPQLHSSIAFPDCTLRFTNDFAYFLEQVAMAFPRQIDGFKRLVRTIADHDALNLDQRQTTSARHVVSEHISDPLLIDMLFCPLMFYGSATPHDMDFSQFVIMFKSIFHEGFGRPFDGIRLILKKLVRHFKALGGHLKLRAGVSE
ncbi:MAG TPA: FAD-binding protein, partial [Fuerstia sp.]|nr:FAD-binding protein [Fuerstiella sp.]